jgi:hypothetical protein
MLYLLAAIGVVTVAVLLWRTFAPARVGVGARAHRIGPDDDPDFLRRLDEQNRGRDDGQNGQHGDVD